MKRLTQNIKKSYDDYYLLTGDTAYTRGIKPKSEYVSPYKEDIYFPSKNVKKRECYNKLGQLEDIEGEIGFDLITLFKALDDGIYVSEQNAENEIVWEEVGLNIHNKTLDFKYPRKEIGKGRPLSMFGKTWALTRGELEK